MWIGWCPSLRVASSGSTRTEATRAVKEAVALWLETCLRERSLDQALAEVGFTTAEKPAERVAAYGTLESLVADEDCDTITVGDRHHARRADYLQRRSQHPAARVHDASPEGFTYASWASVAP